MDLRTPPTDDALRLLYLRLDDADRAFILIVWRELSITLCQDVDDGRGVAGQHLGKSKAVLYAISGALGILAVNLGIWAPASALSAVVQKSLNPVFALAAVASVISFLTYVKAIIKSGALSSMSR